MFSVFFCLSTTSCNVYFNQVIFSELVQLVRSENELESLDQDILHAWSSSVTKLNCFTALKLYFSVEQLLSFTSTHSHMGLARPKKSTGQTEQS